MPLAGLMTGITEVVLPLEERLRKIEETEEVKRRMLAAASRRWAAELQKMATCPGLPAC